MLARRGPMDRASVAAVQSSSRHRGRGWLLVAALADSVLRHLGGAWETLLPGDGEQFRLTPIDIRRIRTVHSIWRAGGGTFERAVTGRLCPRGMSYSPGRNAGLETIKSGNPPGLLKTGRANGFRSGSGLKLGTAAIVNRCCGAPAPRRSTKLAELYSRPFTRWAG